MVNFIFPKQSPEMRVSQMRSTITNNHSRTTGSRKYIANNKSINHSMIVCPRWYRLDPFGHIIHRYKNIYFPFDCGNGLIKSIPQRSKIYTSRIVCKGISSCFEMFNADWHFRHSLKYLTASLNRVGQYKPLSSTFAPVFLDTK